MAVWGDMSQNVGDEGQISRSLNLGDDDGIDERRGSEGSEVFEGKAGGDGVDSDGELGDGVRARREGCEMRTELLAGRRLERGCDGVFEVIGDVVGGEAERLGQHLLRRRRHWAAGRLIQSLGPKRHMGLACIPYKSERRKMDEDLAAAAMVAVRR